MTCHDAREQFSALVDDALATEERAAVDAHLATCADCRRELQRFRDTVALMRAVAPVRAPAGFVDRVLEAARPAPWPRRLIRGLFLPWPVKLPMEAAAIVLVAVGVALVYRGAPELEQSDGVQSGPAAVSQAPSTPPPAGTSMLSRETMLRERFDTRELPKSKDEAPALAKGQQPGKAPEPEQVRAQSMDKKNVTAPEPALAQRYEAPSRDAEVRPTLEPGAKQDLQAARKLEAPPAVGERDRDRASAKDSARPQPAPSPSARVETSTTHRLAPEAGAPAVVSPDVLGQLAVSDLDGAMRSVRELIARLGAVEDRRAYGPYGPILEVTIPREAYSEFIRELARLGGWRPSKEPSTLPARVRVVLQITG
jgi:putative zinc finger protein